MEYEAITALWEKQPGWRLLRATNAPLVLAFLGHHFVEENQGATAAEPGEPAPLSLTHLQSLRHHD